MFGIFSLFPWQRVLLGHIESLLSTLNLSALSNRQTPRSILFTVCGYEGIDLLSLASVNTQHRHIKHTADDRSLWKCCFCNFILDDLYIKMCYSLWIFLFTCLYVSTAGPKCFIVKLFFPINVGNIVILSMCSCDIYFPSVRPGRGTPHMWLSEVSTFFTLLKVFF